MGYKQFTVRLIWVFIMPGTDFPSVTDGSGSLWIKRENK